MKKIKYKKYLCVFLFALFQSVLLCGCASNQDEVTMALLNTKTTETQSEEMTAVSFLEKELALETSQIYIYVCGAVELPGVYCLEEGSRLYEAIALAGGLSIDADENCLNMARQIVDGEQIVILTQAEAALQKEAGTYRFPMDENTSATATQGSSLVNINTATVAELTTVSGIGESRAQAIVAYREKNGSFGSIEEIKKVDGIKEGLFSKIKDKITT
ncbi:ComE operon protein 1 [Lachnospiraceae bacterium]|nr:ComE operon protein 1 [Lachnospiraceae bacterium]